MWPREDCPHPILRFQGMFACPGVVYPPFIGVHASTSQPHPWESHQNSNKVFICSNSEK